MAFALIRIQLFGGPQGKLCTSHKILKTYVENCNVALRTNEVEHNLENRIRTSNMLKGLPQCSRMNLNYQVYFPDVVSN